MGIQVDEKGLEDVQFQTHPVVYLVVVQGNVIFVNGVPLLDAQLFRSSTQLSRGVRERQVYKRGPRLRPNSLTKTSVTPRKSALPSLSFVLSPVRPYDDTKTIR